VFTTDLSDSLVIHRASGAVTLDDILKTMEGWFAHPDFEAGRPVLWDLRDAEFEVSEDAVSAWAESMLTGTNRHRAGHKTAWVLPTSEVASFAVDLLASHDFQNKVRIYQNDLEAARAWLTTQIR
jgi:hypothetical protein